MIKSLLLAWVVWISFIAHLVECVPLGLEGVGLSPLDTLSCNILRSMWGWLVWLDELHSGEPVVLFCEPVRTLRHCMWRRECVRNQEVIKSLSLARMDFRYSSPVSVWASGVRNFGFKSC